MENCKFLQQINSTDPALPIPVLLLTGISSSMSIAGALIIFVSFGLIDNNVRNETRRLLLYLTIADFLTCSSIMFGLIRYIITYVGRHELISDYLHSNDMCVAQSFVTTFSSMSSFFWTIVIAVHLCSSVIFQKDYMSKRKVKITTHIVCWIIPLVITTSAALDNALGEDFSVYSGPWCWIRGRLDPQWSIFWMTLTGKGWEILMYILSMAFIMHLKWFLWKRNKNGKRDGFADISSNIRNEDRNYMWLPLVLYVLRLWGTVRFFLAIARKNSDVDSLPNFNTWDNILLYLQSIGDSLQAFCNCILFCFFDKPVRKSLATRLICNRKGNKESDEKKYLLRRTCNARYNRVVRSDSINDTYN